MGDAAGRRTIKYGGAERDGMPVTEPAAFFSTGGTHGFDDVRVRHVKIKVHEPVS